MIDKSLNLGDMRKGSVKESVPPKRSLIYIFANYRFI